jgi:hypothetical protein
MNILKRIEPWICGGLYLVAVLLSVFETNIISKLIGSFDAIIALSVITCFINTVIYAIIVTKFEKLTIKE